MKTTLHKFLTRTFGLLAVIVATAPYALCAQLVFTSDPSDSFYSIGHMANGNTIFAGSHQDQGGYFTYDAVNGFNFTAVGALSSGGAAVAQRISSDGTRIVGFSESPSTSVGYEATLWNIGSPNSPTGLGFLGGASKSSSAFGIGTANGSTIVVGSSSSSLGTSGFSWTSAGGMTPLPRTGLPTLTSGATGISSDGSVWSGTEDPTGPNTYRAVYGNASGVFSLDALGNQSSTAVNISRNGSVIVGGIGQQAAFWSGESYSPTLITLDDAPLFGTATASDGGLVVGVADAGFGWIADASGHAQKIDAWLLGKYGISLDHNITAVNDIYVSDGNLELALQGSAYYFKGAISSVPEPTSGMLTALFLTVASIFRVAKKVKSN